MNYTNECQEFIVLFCPVLLAAYIGPPTIDRKRVLMPSFCFVPTFNSTVPVTGNSLNTMVVEVLANVVGIDSMPIAPELPAIPTL